MLATNTSKSSSAGRLMTLITVKEGEVRRVVAGYGQAQRGNEFTAMFVGLVGIHKLPYHRPVGGDFQNASCVGLVDQGVAAGQPLRATSIVAAVERIVVLPII